MNKVLILFLYGVALWIVLHKWYSEGNSGIPDPQVVRNPTYLYGILGLTADFLNGLPIVLAAGLTVSLYWQTHNSTSATTTQKKASTG